MKNVIIYLIVSATTRLSLLGGISPQTHEEKIIPVVFKISPLAEINRLPQTRDAVKSKGADTGNLLLLFRFLFFKLKHVYLLFIKFHIFSHYYHYY